MCRAVKSPLVLLICFLCAMLAVAYCRMPAEDLRSTKLRPRGLTPQQVRSLQDPRNMALRQGWEPDHFFQDKDTVSAGDCILNGNSAKLRELLKAGLDVNLAGRHNMTLLFWAFVCEKPGAFELLLEAGADPDVAIEPALDAGMDGVFYEGDTVLLAAARRRRGPFVLRGVPYSREIEKRGAGGASLFNLVVDGCPAGPVLQALIEAGAEINSMDRTESNAVDYLTAVCVGSASGGCGGRSAIWPGRD
jgi:hypothetical protein